MAWLQQSLWTRPCREASSLAANRGRFPRPDSIDVSAYGAPARRRRHAARYRADARPAWSCRQRAPRDLGDLLAQSGGAVALVSGRTIDTLDRLFAPLIMPAIGGHGAEMRLSADGSDR